MVVLEPGAYFQRKTNLPDNWLSCRIGLILSYTNTVGLNSAPNLETIAANVSPKFHHIYGLSNGVGFPGEAGNRFVGFRDGTSTAGPKIETSAGNWRLVTSANPSNYEGNSVVYDGVTQNLSGTSQSFANTFSTPTAADTCMFALAFNLNVVTANTLVMGVLTTGGNLSNASDATLAGFLTNGSYSGTLTATGGWWNNTSTFCGLQYLAFRSSFLTNRLRVLNMMVIQTA